MAHLFEVMRWISEDVQQGVQITRPKVVSCWSKKSSKDGGEYVYGSTDGKFFACAYCAPLLLTVDAMHCSGLSKYHPPELNQSLEDGYPVKYLRKNDGESVPVEVIIRGAQHAAFNIVNNVKFCTFRNNLNKILITPLSLKDEWMIDACYYQGTMFLDIVKTPQKEYPGSDKFTFYGYKFEALCSGSNDDFIDSTSEFALLLSLRLGSHSILMAAEVDCANPSMDTSLLKSGTGLKSDQFLELKTTKIPNAGHLDRFQEKFPKFWVQSFLAGIPTIIVGGRNHLNILSELRTLEVARLPSLAAAAGCKFDAWQLLRFADSLLSWMSENGKAHPGEHLRFHFKPQDKNVHFDVIQENGFRERLEKELSKTDPTARQPDNS